MNESPEVNLKQRRLQREPSAHLWWARRWKDESVAGILLTHDAGSACDPEYLQMVAEGPISNQGSVLGGQAILDLCSGAATTAEAAQRLGGDVTAVDNHPIPVLIARVALEFPSRFADPNADALGAANDGTWGGLAEEFQHWSGVLIARTKECAGDSWLEGSAGLIRSRVLLCDSCGHEAPAARTRPIGDVFELERGSARCPECGQEASARAMVTSDFATRFKVPLERGQELQSASTDFVETVAYPSGVDGRIDETWVVGSTRMSYRDSVSPRQARLLASMQDAFRSIRDELADSGYSPEHAAALLTLLALAISGMIDRLSTFTRWDERRNIARGLDRHEWIWTPEFFEMGGPLVEAHMQRRIADLLKIIKSGPRDSVVEVLSQDMRSLQMKDEQFDLVVWDPPYYDNIDYERLALPFTRLLRVLIGDLYPDLQWSREPACGKRPSGFDAEGYGEGLLETASEIARVLRPGGRLGVFWFLDENQTADDLRSLLEVLEPSGLELIQSVALRAEGGRQTDSESAPHPQQFFLVFRRTPGVRPADAGAVLESAVADRPATYRGLAELLLQNLDAEEIDYLIPAAYRGSREQRLLELVLSQPDPRDLLDELSNRSLRAFIKERNAPDIAKGTSREELKDQAFALLGWLMPREPDFTIGAALDQAENLVSQLRMATSETAIRGTGTAAFDRIEQVVRFTVITWASWLRDGDWQSLLHDALGVDRRLSFGHWYRAFVEVPKNSMDEQVLMGQIGRRLKSEKVFPTLESSIATRNKFIHNEDVDVNWTALRDEAVAVISKVIGRLRKAENAGALPSVLQPLSETRDPFGRIVLRLKGHREEVEFLMTEASDLTQPLVIVHGDTNPREVDPVQMHANLVSKRAGVARSETEK